MVTNALQPVESATSLSAPSPSAAVCLSVNGIGVRYLEKPALWRRQYFWPLRDISFEVRRGETLGVIGRNGAGKSTLLRLLGGIIEPDRGEIRRADMKALLLSLRVGLQPNLSGRENVIQSGIMLGMSHRQISQRVEEIARFADIGPHFERPVRTYSSGMRARVGFAVAVQAKPELLLIDEVLGVGDKDFRAKSRNQLLNKINSDVTVVLASHSEDTIRELCDRVVWIERGETRAVGDSEEILARYLADGEPRKGRGAKRGS